MVQGSGEIRELYLESEKVGLKGKIDIVDRSDSLQPVERKRGDRYWYNDELQVAAYGLLLEAQTGEGVEEGVIYLYGTDERHTIAITEEHRQAVKTTIQEMRSMEPDDPPPLVDNPNKCEKCSTRSYCLPRETALLEPHQATDTGWEDMI